MPQFTPASSAVLYAVRLWTRATWKRIQWSKSGTEDQEEKKRLEVWEDDIRRQYITMLIYVLSLFYHVFICFCFVTFSVFWQHYNYCIFKMIDLSKWQLSFSRGLVAVLMPLLRHQYWLIFWVNLRSQHMQVPTRGTLSGEVVKFHVPHVY